MIRIEATPHGGLLVIGTLEGAALSGLLGIRSDTKMVLDLSGVREADAAAVRMLAQFPPGCRLVNCPRWLALWIGRERQPQNSDTVVP